MSEMVRNKGIIKELYPELKTFGEKVAAFADQQGVSLDEVAKNYYEDDWDIVDYHNFAKIGERFFDISDAKDDYDSDEELEQIERLNETDYRIDLYYYNGGTCMEELIEKWLTENPGPVIQPSVFYAIKGSNGSFRTGAGNSSLPTPRLYLTEDNARKAAEKVPLYKEDGYEIVRFVEQ